MKVLIQVVFGSTARFMQKGNFDVNAREFKEDSDKEAARVAYKWIKGIKQASTHDLEILQVKYNEVHDITELVKEISISLLI